MELALILWVVCAICGAMMRGSTGAILGLLLGPIGVIIAVIMGAGDDQ